MIQSLPRAPRPRQQSLSEREARRGVIAAVKLLRMLALYYLRFAADRYMRGFRPARRIDIAPADPTAMHFASAGPGTVVERSLDT
jgi:hypothetical protein